MELSTLDLVIVALYVGGLLVFGISLGVRESSEDYLVVSRRAPFLLVLFSIISTWVGVGTTVATAASAYEKGISLGLTGAVGGLVGVIVAALVAPRIKAFGDQHQAHTLADFLAVRYGSRVRLVTSCLVIVVYLLLTAAQFVGFAMLLDVWAGATFEITIVAAALTTIFYTAFAGIKSDFFTDAIHFWVMTLVLSLVLLPRASSAVGGLKALRALPSEFWDPFAYGGVSFFIAGLVFGVAGVFVTMEIWQRIYASSTARSARAALFFSGVIIVVFYLLSAILGMLTRIAIPDLPLRDHALFALMIRTLPSGLLGLGIAAFLSIFISTVNSMMMVVSASITKDIYVSFMRPHATPSQIIRSARIATVGAGLIGLLLALVVADVVKLGVNSLFILLVLLPSVLGGFYWRKATARASFWSIIGGVLVICVLLPFYPNEAFAPGFLVSSLIFWLLSYFAKESENNPAHPSALYK